MRLIIAGSRYWDVPLGRVAEEVVAFENKLGRETEEVVCGMARGADRAGYAWAKKEGVPVKEFPANFEQLGKRAGPIRNAQMAEYADAALVFWDPMSSTNGSSNMALHAFSLGLPVRVVKRSEFGADRW